MASHSKLVDTMLVTDTIDVGQGLGPCQGLEATHSHADMGGLKKQDGAVGGQ